MIEINKNAPVTCSKSITINRETEKVWEVLTDIDHWTNWQTEIKKSKLLGELKPGTGFVWKSGGLTINSAIHTVDTNRMLGWTGKALGTFAIHNWILKKEANNTTVIVEESMEGFLVSLFKKTFQKNLNTSLQKWLELLKLKCEQNA